MPRTLEVVEHELRVIVVSQHLNRAMIMQLEATAKRQPVSLAELNTLARDLLIALDGPEG